MIVCVRLAMRDEEYGAMFELEEQLWWYQGMRAVTAALLDPKTTERKPRRLLDVGCGTGFSLLWLRDRLKADLAAGVDLSPLAGSFWGRRKIDTAVTASICALPFSNAEFDLVTSFDVIYQLDEARAHEALSELNRVLKPGGLLFIREPAYEWMRGSHDIAVATQHRYKLGELKRLLASHGLKPIRATYANTLLFAAAVPHRILSRLRGTDESDVRPVAPLLNRTLEFIMRLEAGLLRRIAMPFGLSTIVLAQKT